LAIRTIVISGLPQPIDSKVLWKKIRKYEGAEKVDWPIKNENGDEDSHTGSLELFFFFLPRKLDSLILLPFLAHVLFTTPSSAFDAVNKLHAHVYKGSLISVTLKKRIDTLAKPTTPLEKNSTNPTTSEVKGKISVATPSHASRLIIRNMPFNATEQDLRAIFLPYGPIFSIQIPTDDKTTKKGDDDDNDMTPTATANKKVRTKGFAFVWMLSKKDAERAMEGCNGMVVRAGTAETLVSDKQKKKKLKRIEKKLKESARAGKKVADEEADPVDEDEDMEKEELMDDKRANERVIAVDWALSKEKWKVEKAKIEEAMHEVSESEGDAEDDSRGSSDSDDEDSDDDDDDDDDEGRLGLHGGEDEDNSDAGSEQDEEENDEQRVKPQLPHPEAGTTLFIRNISFSATEDELRTL
jgi:nucleolar protein 4